MDTYVYTWISVYMDIYVYTLTYMCIHMPCFSRIHTSNPPRPSDVPIPFLLSSRGPGLLLASSYRSEWRLDSPGLRQELWEEDEDEDGALVVLAGGVAVEGVEIPSLPFSVSASSGSSSEEEEEAEAAAAEGVLIGLGAGGQGEEESGLTAVARRERQRQLRGLQAAAAAVEARDGVEEDAGGAYEFVVRVRSMCKAEGQRHGMATTTTQQSRP